MKIAAVVKSNGYGHGIVNVAKVLDSLKAPFFCVDSLYEAFQLQKAKVKTPILVIGYTNPENFKQKKLPFSFAVYNLEIAKALSKFQPGCSIHIFVDTGMHREGVRVENLTDFLEQAKSLSGIKIEGLMSHLASSEGKTDPIFKAQIKRFNKAKDIFKKAGVKPKWFHIAATGSITNPQTRKIITEVSNLARAGLSLYGYSPIDQNLKPALILKSHIVQIKHISKGEKIGYDGTYTAKKKTTVGVIPIGYYDGIDRRLSNKGVVLVDDTPCLILGKVSMNVNIIDLNQIANPRTGQKVIIYSDNPKNQNSIANSAKICKTIPYDLLVNLAESTKREVL